MSTGFRHSRHLAGRRAEKTGETGKTCEETRGRTTEENRSVTFSGSTPMGAKAEEFTANVTLPEAVETHSQVQLLPGAFS